MPGLVIIPATGGIALSIQCRPEDEPQGSILQNSILAEIVSYKFKF
jgi:hypothetical protein